MKTHFISLAVILAAISWATIVNAALPDPGMEIVPGRTALLITDPQNDFLSPQGVAWGVVGKNGGQSDSRCRDYAVGYTWNANDTCPGNISLSRGIGPFTRLDIERCPRCGTRKTRFAALW